MNANLKALRTQLRRKRRNIPSAKRRQLDSHIFQRLLQTKLVLRSPRLAAYLANDGEPNLNAFLLHAFKTRSTCFLPALNRKKLSFRLYERNSTLLLNTFGIAEPCHQTLCPPRFLSVVLIPLVGFDHQGNRLGMGGGFYDRTFNFMRHGRENAPLLIGIAYETQRVESLPTQAWDIPIDAVVTENNIHCFTAKAKSLLS